MANPHKGEVALELGGKSYKLDLTTNGIAEAEREADMPFDAVVQNLDRVFCVRATFYGALVEHHPGVTARGAGEIIHKARQAGEMEKLLKAVVEAIQLSRVEPDRTDGAPKDP